MTAVHLDSHPSPPRRRAVMAAGLAVVAGLVGSVAAQTAATFVQADEPAAALPNVVAASSDHTCAVNTDTTVSCWGDNDNGQLGDGTEDDSVQPVAVAGLVGAVEVAAGDYHSCARLASGTVQCWGANFDGQLGDDTGNESPTPVAVVGLADAIAIAAAYEHTCAVRTSGDVVCWGYNGDGQLGDGTTDTREEPVSVPGLAGAVAIGVGTSHSCAALDDGYAWCWGYNSDGQLGDGTTDDALTPVRVAGLTGVTSISGGEYSTCAVASGLGYCWGDNDDGHLGNGTLDDSLVPVPVSHPTGMEYLTAIRPGYDSTCALDESGQAWCWGDGYRGKLGNGESEGTITIPSTVDGIDDAVALGFGEQHACAVRSNGSVWCWGDSYDGQVGSGLPGELRTPIAVAGLAPVDGVAAAGDATCAVHTDGTMSCWGSNREGQLGRGTVSGFGGPATVPGLADVQNAVGGQRHFCAWRTTGTAACWGDNGDGQLGDGTENDAAAPVEATLTTVERMAAGDDHSCARLTGGALQCWGENFRGQLGIGSTTDQLLPTTVATVANGGAIAAGGETTCVRRTSGAVECWGDNIYGQVGDGTTTQRTAPVAINTMPNDFQRVDVGADHACASRPTGTMCWGDNIYGQLGDGSNTGRLSPVDVVGASGGVVQAGDGFTCLLDNGGTVQCWGANYDGQLGDDGVFSSDTPVDVVGITTATDLSAGADHACVVLADATVWCWGANYEGQLGQPSYFATAVQVLGVIAPIPPTPAPDAPLVPLTPARLLDTRPGQPTYDGQYAGQGARSAGSVLELQVTGRGGVAVDAAAAVLNITSVNALAPGYVTAYPCDASQPLASSLNYVPGTATPNEVIAKLSPTGTVCLYTLAGVDLVVDVTGWSPAGSAYTPLVPARLLDTRPGQPTYDGQYAGQGRRTAGTTLELPVAGRGNVPADAAAVAVNVTAVDGGAPGYVTVYPCDTTQPLASSLNYAPGQVTPNEVIAKLSATGTLCLYTLSDVDLIVDVTGAMALTSAYTPLAPARFLDTRPGEPTVDGQYAGIGRRTAGSTLELPITGRNGLPAAAAAATVNITAVNGGAPGFVTVYPCDEPRPLASSLNYLPGTATPNEVVAKLSATGTLCLYTLTDVDLIVDVTGIAT